MGGSENAPPMTKTISPRPRALAELVDGGVMETKPGEMNCCVRRVVMAVACVAACAAAWWIGVCCVEMHWCVRADWCVWWLCVAVA